MKQEGEMEFRGFKTWYEVHGNLEGKNNPLILLHGGPGYPHYHLENIAQLASDERAVVMYDQIGCGKSERPDDSDLWHVEFFVDELKSLIRHLGIEKADILGHSWGGSLALEYAFTKPKELDRLILSSPLIDTQLWVEEADKLKDQLPPEVAATMRQHELAGTTSSDEYEAAVEVFNEYFVCRIKPLPDSLQRCNDEAGAQVYNTMWGPSEAHATGRLKQWSSIDRMSDVEVPTLILSGEYDEATPKQMKIANETIEGSRWVQIEGGSHASNFENEARYMQLVKEFLEQE